MSESAGQTFANGCFLLFFLPLVFIVMIWQWLWATIGGFGGFVAAIIVAGIIFWIWYESNGNNPVVSTPVEAPQIDSREARTLDHP